MRLNQALHESVCGIVVWTLGLDKMDKSIRSTLALLMVRDVL